jgi:hypothetical protein
MEPLLGQVGWRWSEQLGREEAVAALLEWRALEVAVGLGDDARSHRARCVREVGV